MSCLKTATVSRKLPVRLGVSKAENLERSVVAQPVPRGGFPNQP